MKKDKKVVCLGGGIGTMNLVKGLKEYTDNMTVVVSMADDGGSAGRLRRLYKIPPPGDLVSCVSAMSNTDPILRDLLTFRFLGDRYGSDSSLPGQKLGNLILVALTSMTGDFYKAVLELQRIYKTSGRILPSTTDSISIWAQTSLGEKIQGEQHIDLGHFKGRIEKVFLEPKNPKVLDEVKNAIKQADLIIAGPGDLYTTIIPVLLIPDILESLKESKAKKLFIINVANKVSETRDYKIEDYVKAVVRHCGDPLFDLFLANDNHSFGIPKKWLKQYSCVPLLDGVKKEYKVVQEDLIDENFPLYHNSKKLARSVWKFI